MTILSVSYNNRLLKYQPVNFKIAVTESPSDSFKAFTAFTLSHQQCSITIFIFSGLMPSSLTSSDSLTASTLVSCFYSLVSAFSAFQNFLASSLARLALKSLNLASPKTMQLFSTPGLFKISGSSMYKRKFFPFLIVTLVIPATGCIPNFFMAFLNFFSPLFGFLPSLFS